MAEQLETAEDWQAGRRLVECNRFMLQHEINCDVTFQLGQKKVPVKAHKYVLISRSSVFQSIFCGSISGANGSDILPVSDIEVDTFKALLLYMYCESSDITSVNVSSLLYAAKKYAVTGLVEQCLDFLESSLCIENVCDVLEKVHIYDGKKLEKRCINFIFENGTTILQSEPFTNLCPECIEQIVKSDELIVDEVLVYKALLRWADRECKRRDVQATDANIREVIGPTLFHVRFPLIHAVFFTSNISCREILNPQEIIAVYQYYHGKQQANNWKFNASRRRGFSLHSVIRFNLILMEEFECKGTTHSICFTSSKAIILHGIVVYGCLEGSAIYQVKLEIKEVNSDSQSSSDDVKYKTKQSSFDTKTFALFDAKVKCLDTSDGRLDSICPKARDSNVTHVVIATERTIHTYDVMLAKTVAVEPGKSYLCSLQMDGPPTKLGFHGKADVSAEGVTFHFDNHKDSESSVEKGQIPGLLFTLPLAQ